MVQERKMTAGELGLARAVYASTTPFDRVFVTNLELGFAVTLAGMDPSSGKFDYTINRNDGLAGVIADAERGVTLAGGDQSRWDSRFPYIRDVIRARNRGAAYRPVTLPGGGDPQIKAMQDRLVALGYLEARHADGLVGRRKSATLNAVKAFQCRNGLNADRDLGGINRQTRQRLAMPAAKLVRAI